MKDTLIDLNYKYDKKDFFSQLITFIISIACLLGGITGLYYKLVINESYHYFMYLGLSVGLWGIMTLINDIFFTGRKLDPVFKNKIIKRELGVDDRSFLIPIVRLPAAGIDSCEARPLRVNNYSIAVVINSRRIQKAYKGYNLKNMLNSSSIVMCWLTVISLYFAVIPFGIYGICFVINHMISWF